MTPVLEPGTLDFISHSEDQTRRIGARLGTLLKAGHVVALLGDLGAGKTRLAQGIGRGINVPADEVINSPTFTFINQYQGRVPLYHIDLYRLSESTEAETLGLDDYFYDEGVCLIEWANRLEAGLLPDRLEVELQHLNPGRRRIIVRAYGSEYTDLLERFKNITFGL